ncbi:MAG: methyltransferase domain-containing protein, partial [Thermoplasmata archaeon]
MGGVVKDPYNWIEIEDSSVDVVISGQAFEHIEYPWLTIKEIYRVL